LNYVQKRGAFELCPNYDPKRGDYVQKKGAFELWLLNYVQKRGAQIFKLCPKFLNYVQKELCPTHFPGGQKFF